MRFPRSEPLASDTANYTGGRRKYIRLRTLGAPGTGVGHTVSRRGRTTNQCRPSTVPRRHERDDPDDNDVSKTSADRPPARGHPRHEVTRVPPSTRDFLVVSEVNRGQSYGPLEETHTPTHTNVNGVWTRPGTRTRMTLDPDELCTEDNGRHFGPR